MRAGTALLSCLPLLFACSDGEPDLSGLVPEQIHRYDPNVVELIEQRMAEIRSWPDNPMAYAKLAYAYEANTLWPAARIAYSEVVRRAPASVDWRFHLAVAQREAGDPEASRRLLLELGGEHPGLAHVQQRLGEALAESGELGAAAAAYKKVIELLPQAPEGYLGLGEVRLLEGDYAAAREALARAVALDPSYRAAHYALGLAYRGLGRLDEAQRELSLGLDARTRYLPDPLREEIQQYAVNLPALRNRAASMLYGGRPDLAAGILEQVLDQQPDNPTDLNNLAIAYMRMGRLDEARQKLEKARDLAPEKFSTWLNFSMLATRNGDFASAAEYAREAIRWAPDMARPQVMLAMAVVEMGQLESAAAALERATELEPHDPQTHGMLAEVYLQLGRYRVAEEQFEAVLALLPDSLTALLKLGKLYLEQDRLDEAENMLTRAVELAPENPRVTEFGRQLDARQQEGEF